jgi:hypothetical protein
MSIVSTGTVHSKITLFLLIPKHSHILIKLLLLTLRTRYIITLKLIHLSQRLSAFYAVITGFKNLAIIIINFHIESPKEIATALTPVQLMPITAVIYLMVVQYLQYFLPHCLALYILLINYISQWKIHHSYAQKEILTVVTVPAP